jgi:hypothetical protein
VWKPQFFRTIDNQTAQSSITGLYCFPNSHAPTAVLSTLRILIDEKKGYKPPSGSPLKRKAHETDFDIPAAKLNVIFRMTTIHRDNYQIAHFLDLPTTEDTRYSYRQFYEAT